MALSSTSASPLFSASASAAPKQLEYLSPFVAKQLLQIAIDKKEECPITGETFKEGESAVMPCGHLFSSDALKAAFHVTPNKCPSCRSTGSPTIV